MQKLIRDYTCPYCKDDCRKTRVRTVTALSVTSNVGWAQSRRGTVQYFHKSCANQNTIGKNGGK